MIPFRYDNGLHIGEKSMEVRMIKYFLAVAEELNITKAAERLHIAQPPLSRQLQNLEEELGTQLFIRGKRRLQLTEEGILLKKRGQQIISLIEKTEEEIKEVQNGVSGTLYISSVEGRGPYLAAEWIAEFKKIYPQVCYNLWNGNSDDVVDRVHKGLSDLAILMEPYDAEILDGIRVYTEPWIAMFPKNNPLAYKDGNTISVCELSEQELIIPSRPSRIREIKRWFSQFHIEPKIVCEMAHIMNAIELTEQGVGVAIFPASAALSNKNDTVIIKEIVEPSVEASYLLAWNKEHTHSMIAEKFIQYVKKKLAEKEEDGNDAPDRKQKEAT